MSAEITPAAPPSRGPTASARARGGVQTWWRRLREEPNPIWLREMRQSFRIRRTPWNLFALTTLVSLLICSIGGLAAAESVTPATLGGALYQVFFSLSYLVVVLVGPALAANAIAAEREGRTWEAVLLTGLSPKEIARGKFLAAYTTLSLYVVVLSPAGAIAFLFGGVTASEVLVGFVFLFLMAGLSVAFGLAVSSLMSNMRGAIVVTLMLAMVLGPSLYFTFGLGGSLAAHHLWPLLPETSPVWLPLAYERVPFGLPYLLLLVLLPLGLLAVPAWLLYEVTIANLTSEHDDRSSGLKRWFVVSTPLLAAASLLPSCLAGSDEGRGYGGCGGILALASCLQFSSFLFTFEPLGPSRRVRARWGRVGAGAVRRFLGPGVVRGQVLVALLGGLSLLSLSAAVVVSLEMSKGPGRVRTYQGQVLALTAYAVAFFVFVCGSAAWLRARNPSVWATRAIHAGILFAITAFPWVVAAIAGVFAQGGSGGRDWLVVAAPSPVFAFVMLASIEDSSLDAAVLVPVGLAAAALWGLLGLLLFGFAARRAQRVIAADETLLLETEAALRAEEARLPANATAPPTGA